MTRSVWKIKKTLNFKGKNTWVTDSVLTLKNLNKTVNIYNGRKFFLVNITEERLNFKLGEFIRRRFFVGHTKNKKKKKGR